MIHTDQILGPGAYGNVVKATLDQEPCAAKILHRVITDSQDPEMRDFITRHVQRHQILQDLRHPNIVQFLGVVQDPRTDTPILLMELMKESLTHFLDNFSTDVPYHLQVNISHDIALAVAYMHRNGILSRNLCSNNVLLNDSCQAKLSNFGMAKIVGLDILMPRKRMTPCPGSPFYMPPEALNPQPCYSDKTDSFSIGVLLLQIATRNYPNPTAYYRAIPDSNSSTGEAYIPVADIDCRKSDLDMVSTFHGFLPIIRACLKESEERPSAAQLCQSLGQLKNTAAYRQSVCDPSFQV